MTLKILRKFIFESFYSRIGFTEKDRYYLMKTANSIICH